MKKLSNAIRERLMHEKCIFQFCPRFTHKPSKKWHFKTKWHFSILVGTNFYFRTTKINFVSIGTCSTHSSVSDVSSKMKYLSKNSVAVRPFMPFRFCKCKILYVHFWVTKKKTGATVKWCGTYNPRKCLKYKPCFTLL